MPNVTKIGPMNLLLAFAKAIDWLDRPLEPNATIVSIRRIGRWSARLGSARLGSCARRRNARYPRMLAGCLFTQPA